MKSESYLQKVLTKLESLSLKILTLSFFTWAFVTLAVCKKWIPLDSFFNYAIFTCAIIGIKSWKAVKEKIEEMK